ncbi:low-density lipoprotein receptor-related protein 2-like [Patiria miniata]|uniref:Uncharacterized protein n=1 Tax=Patiria miniata TaxID=46514 RepID=A0A914BB43_PATMI|nr:low-density lipoprotein receptor-related protein 2-like [Patiria miniata]
MDGTGGSRKRWCLQHFLLSVLLTTFRTAHAGDFALIADLNNGTIYAGSMGRSLVDLAPLPLSGIVRPVTVDFDPQERMIYWSDLRSQPSPKISRANLDGSNQMTIAENLRLPDGLALDVEARILYWTDGVLGHVGRASMNGTGNKEIIVENLDQPRTIVTDHSHGHIYWTDWGSSPRIERADLDGGNRTSVVDSDLHWPNGVTIDADYLYWCDAFLNKIERSDLSGQNRELVIDLNPYGDLHPYDLDVYRGDVYWTDWKVNTLIRVSLNGRGEGNFGPSTFQQPGGIHIEEEPDHCDSSPCDNGAPCEDVIGGFLCQCPPGLQGTTCSDATSCVLPPDPSDVLMVVSGQQAVYLPGDSVQYACPDGYQLSGSTTRICLSDLTWSGQQPTCSLTVVGCAPPTPDPSDVLMVVSGGQAVYHPGDSVQYACPDGYQLSGSATRICLSDFTWAGEAPVCQDELEPTPDVSGCTPPTPGPSDVLMVVSDQRAVYLPGDSVQYACPDGYQLSGSATRICRSDFTWAGEAPQCMEDDPATVSGCTPPTPDPSDVLMVVSDQRTVYQLGDSVQYACPDGYQLSGSATRRCRSDFTWTGQAPQCKKEDPISGKSTGAIPVAIIAGGSGGAVLFLVAVAIICVVAITVKRRRRRRFGGRVPISDIADRTCKEVFPKEYSTYVHYEKHIAEPLYSETLF